MTLLEAALVGTTAGFSIALLSQALIEDTGPIGRTMERTWYAVRDACFWPFRRWMR
jgi:hypothetical protein